MRLVHTAVLTIAILAVAALASLAAQSPQAAMRSASGRIPADQDSALASKILNIKEINYYPADNAWTYMWTNFDPAAIGKDFAKIRALGANVVRIFVQPSVFGYPAVLPAMASELSQVIALAAQNGLRVHLTLFDLWSQAADITGSEEWVSSLLSGYAGDPRIVIVELHNEVNVQNSADVTWVTKLLPYLSSVMPGTLRTVSVADISPQLFAQFTHELGNSLPDFWDYHYYGPASGAYSRLKQIQALAAPLPLFIGETGYSTAGTTQSQAAAEQAQASYYQGVFSATQALGLADPAPWILNDFAPGAIPPGITSGASQYGFGLYRVDGTPKPAAAIVQEGFGGTLGNSARSAAAVASPGSPAAAQVADLIRSWPRRSRSWISCS